MGGVIVKIAESVSPADDVKQHEREIREVVMSEVERGLLVCSATTTVLIEEGGQARRTTTIIFGKPNG